MAHGDAREGKWRGNWRTEWVASILHTTSELGVSTITTADAHTSAASSRLNWCPRRFKRTRPFRQKIKSGLCECAITFQLVYTSVDVIFEYWEKRRWAHYHFYYACQTVVLSVIVNNIYVTTGKIRKLDIQKKCYFVLATLLTDRQDPHTFLLTPCCKNWRGVLVGPANDAIPHSHRTGSICP